MLIETPDQLLCWTRFVQKEKEKKNIRKKSDC